MYMIRMSNKRVKIYQITNNVTDDVYVGTTPQASGCTFTSQTYLKEFSLGYVN